MMNNPVSRPGRHVVPLQIILPVTLTVILFIITIFLAILPIFEKNMMVRKREMIRELTHSALSTLSQLEERQRAGQLTLEEAQTQGKEHIRTLRYGPDRKDYFWITDIESKVLVHPYRPDLEGQDGAGLIDPTGKHFIIEFTQTGKEQGAGYVDYYWQWKDDPNRIVPKISYVKLFPPWGWVVGTGIYVEDVREEISAISWELTWICLLILAVISVLSAYIIWQGTRSERKRRSAEEELRRLNMELENRVVRRTTQLAESNALIQDKNQMLDQTVQDLRMRERTMAEELELAQEVQLHFLPKAFPFHEELRFAALYRSSSKIGGDLYDAFRLSERVAGFYIADASGHGVSAALVTAVLKVSFERFLQGVSDSTQGERASVSSGSKALHDCDSLAVFMQALNQAMLEIIPENVFVTFLFGVFNLDTGILLIANAGHDEPLWYRKKAGMCEVLEIPSNLALGLQEDFLFEIARFQLQPGDKITAFTDGLTELMNLQGEQFGLDRLREIVQAHGSLSPEDLLSKIKKASSVFARNCEPHDDQAVLVMEYARGR